MDLKKAAEELVRLSSKEVQELAEVLKDEYGLVISKVELIDASKDVILVSEQMPRKNKRDVRKALDMRYKRQKGTYGKGHVNRYNVRKNRR